MLLKKQMPDILLMTYKFLFDDSDREDSDYSDEANPNKENPNEESSFE